MSDFRLLIIGLALLGLAGVGLSVFLRAERHVAASRERVARGAGLPLESLSHRLLPWAETPRGYRAIGVGMIVVALALFFYALNRLA